MVWQDSIQKPDPSAEHPAAQSSPAGPPPQLRFAILAHRINESVHWDLLLELPERDGLAAWRIHRPPEQWPHTHQDPAAPDSWLTVEELAPHRKVYLTYEGPVSGNRGTVEQVDGGRLTIHRYAEQSVTVTIEGTRFHYQLTLRSNPLEKGRWHFKASAPQ